jgi:hypothetical protein
MDLGCDIFLMAGRLAGHAQEDARDLLSWHRVGAVAWGWRQWKRAKMSFWGLHRRLRVVVRIGILNALLPQSRREYTLWVGEAPGRLSNPTPGGWQGARPAASRPQDGGRYRARLERGDHLQQLGR